MALSGAYRLRGSISDTSSPDVVFWAKHPVACINGSSEVKQMTNIGFEILYK